MSKWKEKRLGEVAEINMGQSPKSIYYNKDNIGTPFLQGNGDFGRIFPIITTYTSSVTKVAHTGDILFSVRAPVGAINIANTAVCIGRGLSSIRSKENYNHIFLRYSLEYLVNEIKKSSNGAIFDSITKNDLYNSRISIPDLATQEKIADILSTYDDLIENNNRRIEILEQMAQEIYKEWFVRFRFPGHEKVKFVNGIPEGWEVKKIKDFGNIITGKTPSTEVYENYGKDIMFIKTPDMHDAVFTTYSSEYLSEKGHLTQVNKLIPANSILVSCIGTAGIVSINAEAAHTNQQINSILLNDENLLYWLFFSCRFLKNTIELYGATGATMTNLSKGKFENLKILMPKQELVYLYNNKVNNIFSHIKKLLYLNQNLIKQRDLLLPRLMSGKLEV